MTSRYRFLMSSVIIFFAIFTSICSAEKDNTLAPQPVSSFDVISVRPAQSDWGGYSHEFRQNGYFAKNVTVSMLLEDAYDIAMESLISGLPAWTESARFDVQAKLDSNSIDALKKLSEAQQRISRKSMLRTLLVDRFGLKVQSYRRSIPVYVLVPVHNRSMQNHGDHNNLLLGLKPTNEDPSKESLTIGGGKLIGYAVSMSTLAVQLSYALDELVIDKTELEGRYSFKLDYAPDNHESHLDSDPRPSLRTALKEQIGLELACRREMLDGIRVLSINPPTSN